MILWASFSRTYLDLSINHFSIWLNFSRLLNYRWIIFLIRPFLFLYIYTTSLLYSLGRIFPATRKLNSSNRIRKYRLNEVNANPKLVTLTSLSCHVVKSDILLASRGTTPGLCLLYQGSVYCLAPEVLLFWKIPTGSKAILELPGMWRLRRCAWFPKKGPCAKLWSMLCTKQIYPGAILTYSSSLPFVLTHCYFLCSKKNKPIVNFLNSKLLLITESQHFGDEYTTAI